MEHLEYDLKYMLKAALAILLLSITPVKISAINSTNFATIERQATANKNAMTDLRKRVQQMYSRVSAQQTRIKLSGFNGDKLLSFLRKQNKVPGAPHGKDRRKRKDNLQAGR